MRSFVIGNKKVRLKKYAFQNAFIMLSIIFILVCGVYYGSRLFKYYKIYNPKNEQGESIPMLSSAIFDFSPIILEGDGLYNYSGSYTFRGLEVNNYLKFSNQLWRVIRAHSDGSVDVILDDGINVLSYDFNNSNYINSDIHKYLNEVFVNYLDTTYLTKTTICEDVISNYSCNNINTEYYVRLLGINDYLNSLLSSGSYITKNNDTIWLGNDQEDSEAWLGNGNGVSSMEKTETYLVKPVITIKNSITLKGGNGTYEEPFLIEDKENVGIGSYVKINNDLWIVYGLDNDKYKLVLEDNYSGKLLSTYRFDAEKNVFDPNSKNSLASYLNNEYFNSLDYNSILLDQIVYTGGYTKSYKDIYSDSVKCKVGILNVADLKFNMKANGYYLSTKAKEDSIYYFNNDIISSKIGISRNYRPTIEIGKINSTSGNGSHDNPYVLEVKNEK